MFPEYHLYGYVDMSIYIYAMHITLFNYSQTMVSYTGFSRHNVYAYYKSRANIRWIKANKYMEYMSKIKLLKWNISYQDIMINVQ